MRLLVFTIPLTPRSKKNSRPIFFNRKTGKRFLGKNPGLSAYEDQCQMLIRAQKNQQGLREPIAVPCHIAFRFELKGCMRLDVDNAMAGINDSLQKAGVVVNDKQFNRSGSWETIEHTGLPDQTIVRITYEQDVAAS